MSSQPVRARDIEAAATRLSGVVAPTPLEPNARLSDRIGASVMLKREDLQPVRSYKARGAYNLIAQLGEYERSRGVVCASAGNHAQGVAFACARLQVTGRVYVPSTTPRQKRERIARIGGVYIDLRIVGDSYDDAAAASIVDSARTGATLVPAFDDVRTIAGQGTIGGEIVAQLGEPPDVLIVPVGGGGLLAGLVTWAATECPQLRIVGVEPHGAASMAHAVASGRPMPLEEMDTFVDGAAVRTAGALTYPIVKRAGVELVEVPVGRLCTEMLDLYQSDGIIAEPAGALATAVLGFSPAGPEIVHVPAGQTVVCVVSGGNNDISRYAEIIERSLIHEGLKHYFLVSFPQEPGALRRFLDEVLGPDDDITLFDYVKRNNRETGPALVGIELAAAEDLNGLLERLATSPITAEHVLPGSPLFRYFS